MSRGKIRTSLFGRKDNYRPLGSWPAVPALPPAAVSRRWSQRNRLPSSGESTQKEYDLMSTLLQSAPQTAPALLPRWANGQDSWTRRIVDDVLKHRAQCPEGD